MAAYLFDTTALLAHYLDEPGAQEVQTMLEDGDCSVLTSAMSLPEFARRLVVLGGDAPSARRRALDYAELVDHVVAVDAALAVRAFELGVGAPARVPLVDCIIAACAQAAEAVLVHRDAHFDSLPGVRTQHIGTA